jgi:hypothetical protein
MITPDKTLDEMSIEELKAENFKLSAYQCHNPLSDDYGHMVCVDVAYWKERCRLAEKLYEGKSDYLCDDGYFQNLEAYEKLIAENGNKPY